MKNKFWIFIGFIILVLTLGCDHYKPIKNKYSELLNGMEHKTVKISEYTIYGTHLNLKGTLNDSLTGPISVVLKNLTKEIEYDVFYNEEDHSFSTNQYINQGIYLENIPVGNYLILLKTVNDNQATYYNLINDTTYGQMEYYTMTRNNSNNQIIIDYATYNEKSYMYLEVKETKLPTDIYDIVLDPGHGGNDPGAVNGKYHEDTLNLEYALMLKDALTDLGLKVKMTREGDVTLKHYGHGSRTGIPYETKAKLMLSLHLNSGTTYNGKGGIEVYMASGDEPTFARTLARNVVENTSTIYSANTYNRLEKGVYVRVYQESDIKSSREGAQKAGWEPYDIKPDTTYYYFIRETGGIMTKAFADGRNPKYDANPYYNANYGAEAYLVELGYISNSQNLKVLLNEKEKYVKAIKESIKTYLENDR